MGVAFLGSYLCISILEFKWGQGSETSWIKNQDWRMEDA